MIIFQLLWFSFKPKNKLDPENARIDGLAFVGLSLTRYSEVGCPDSITHQTAFDFNEILDRDYQFLLSTNDDGWLVGGGKCYQLKTPSIWSSNTLSF